MKYKPDPALLKDLSFSIVIETENLGMAGIADLEETLDSLLNQTYSINNAKEVMIIAGGHVGEESLSFLKNKYPFLSIHRENKKLEYTQAKMRGAELATTEIVIFVDSDVVYKNTWLENILYTFIWSPGATLVAGETRIRGDSIYSMAIRLVWMMDVVPRVSHPRVDNNFYFNNFAVKRESMLSVPLFSGYPVYRANTVEWKKQFLLKGFSIIKAPNAEGFHLPPGNFMDWWYRMLISGSDAVVKGGLYFQPSGEVIERFSPWRRFYRIFLFVGFKMFFVIKRSLVLLREDFLNIIDIILALPIVIMCLVAMFLGSFISFFDKNYLFNKITARENDHVV